MGGDKFSVVVSTAVLAENPDSGHKIGKSGSQLLFGEIFVAERIEGEWLYGASVSDEYKGYVHISNLCPAIEATHFIDALWTHIYPEPDYKNQPVMGLPMMAQVRSGVQKDNFVEVPGHGWIFAAHLTQQRNGDHVEAAVKFEGCPYLYGGRSATGIDCSGLVQIALSRAGIPCPRDSGPQAEVLGKIVSRDDLKRGDLVFFKGHVGIMLDSENTLNATARTMDVRIEKLSVLEKAYGELSAAKRI